MWEVFKSKIKLPKVVFRKLGKEQVWGLSHPNLIEVDSRLRGKRRLEILFHELLHWQFTDLDEQEIIKKSRELTEFMWKLGYRKIENNE